MTRFAAKTRIAPMQLLLITALVVLLLALFAQPAHTVRVVADFGGFGGGGFGGGGAGGGY